MSAQKLREGGNTTAIVSGGRRKLHTTWDDGSELIEEYDAKTDKLLLRKRRRPGTLGGAGAWTIEVGDERTASQPFNPETTMLAESSANPVFSRGDAQKAFQWRVRNVPYPPGTFSVTVDTDADVLVIRTSNKKYYKRFEVPEMRRLGRKLDEEALTYSFADATLLVQYAKPLEVLREEAEDKLARAKISSSSKDGDVDCKQQ